MHIELLSKKILLFIPVVVIIVFTTGVAAPEEENVSVRVNVPEFVSGMLDATIDIDGVTDLTSGEFNLFYDPDVVSVVDVEPGNIDDTEVPIEMWRAMDDKVKVLFKLPEAGLVSGSGYLATIGFEVVGNDGDTSALEVSDGCLFSYTSDDNPILGGNTVHKEINADWSGDVVTVGNVGTVTTALTPVQTTPPRSTSSLDSGTGSVAASAHPTQHVSDAAAPVETSEKNEQDGLKIITTHNFIAIYSFVGLLAFIYTLTLLR